MLARLSVHTPFIMLVPEGIQYTLQPYEAHGLTVVARPPGRSEMPLNADVPEGIVLDDIPGFAANTLQIDFYRESFARLPSGPYDPSEAVLQEAFHSLLRRLRYVTRGLTVTQYDLAQATWRVQYLNDDGSELPEDKAAIRGIGTRVWQWSLVSITPAIWDEVNKFDPSWTSPPWDDIILDAAAALPRIGTSVVLAATALEVFIADVLDRIAAGGTFPPDVWQWINHRKDYESNPATDEQFDILLKHFTGHSLKEEKLLWEAFMNLRTARNKFVHEGLARIGGVAVTSEKAAMLVARASEIIACIREWVPESLRWPQPHVEVKVALQHPIS